MCALLHAALPYSNVSHFAASCCVCGFFPPPLLSILCPFPSCSRVPCFYQRPEYNSTNARCFNCGHCEPWILSMAKEGHGEDTKGEPKSGLQGHTEPTSTKPQTAAKPRQRPLGCLQTLRRARFGLQTWGPCSERAQWLWGVPLSVWRHLAPW